MLRATDFGQMVPRISNKLFDPVSNKLFDIHENFVIDVANIAFQFVPESGWLIFVYDRFVTASRKFARNQSVGHWQITARSDEPLVELFPQKSIGVLAVCTLWSTCDDKHLVR